MKRLLDWLWGRVLLYVLLVVLIAFVALAWPGLPQLARSLSSENLSGAEITALLKNDLAAQQARLAQHTNEARTLGADQIATRIAEREAARAEAEARKQAAQQGLFAAYRPSRVVARSRAEIEIAALDSELAMLRTALAPRRNLEAARRSIDRKRTMPLEETVAAAQQRCDTARAAVAAFNQRWKIDQGLRETFQLQRTELNKTADDTCNKAAEIAADRARGLQARQQLNEAKVALAALAADPLPESLIASPDRVTLRDILANAFLALLAITLVPFIYRTIAYHLLAPIAARWPPMRFAAAGTPPPQPVVTPSAISLGIQLQADEEALVRQDYLQSSSLKGTKRTRWLLDWRRPLTSFASGMRFLTAIRGDGERVTISAVKDPLAELAILTVPKGAACVLRPSALAAVVQPQGQPVQITPKWRFGLPAWLTWQWRYLAFHGPARLVVKGGRGVRIEPAERGRIVGEGQILGFSTDLSYSVIRSETFWPYFFGREALLKDRVEQGTGVLLIEEAPLAGRSALRRGVAGVWDALLKVGGV